MEGYGAKLVRRVLLQLAWREAIDEVPLLLWNGSTQGRKQLKEDIRESHVDVLVCSII